MDSSSEAIIWLENPDNWLDFRAVALPMFELIEDNSYDASAQWPEPYICDKLSNS